MFSFSGSVFLDFLDFFLPLESDFFLVAFSFLTIAVVSPVSMDDSSVIVLLMAELLVVVVVWDVTIVIVDSASRRSIAFCKEYAWIIKIVMEVFCKNVIFVNEYQ